MFGSKRTQILTLATKLDSNLTCHVSELKVLLEVGLGESGNWDNSH
jgi:hypothetical protein